MSTTNPIILTGTASPQVAAGIALAHQFPLFFNRVIHFANSEMKVTLAKEIQPDSAVTIVQSTCNPANDNFIELCLIADTLRREGISNMSAIIPYLGYSRQDKQHLPKECISIQTMCTLLSSVGISSVTTLDIHNASVVPQCDMPIINVSAMPFLAKSVRSRLGITTDNEHTFTITSPDAGGIARAGEFADHFYADQKNREVVSMKKERELDKTHVSRAVSLDGNIQDMHVILIDDVSTSGGTLMNAAELCKANGVKDVHTVVVHADFAQGTAARLQYCPDISTIFTTNSIERTIENLDLYSKIQVIDISQVFDLK